MLNACTHDALAHTRAPTQVYWPYLLMNKKRYAGLLWTQSDKSVMPWPRQLLNETLAFIAEGALMLPEAGVAAAHPPLPFCHCLHRRLHCQCLSVIINWTQNFNFDFNFNFN
jgi:hypothetical protein